MATTVLTSSFRWGPCTISGCTSSRQRCRRSSGSEKTNQLPDKLEHGQVLVRVHTTSICGAQINEIDAVKGEDKFLPHLLGHEALATVVQTGPGVVSCRDGDTVIMHWRPGKGIQSATPVYSWRGKR